MARGHLARHPLQVGVYPLAAGPGVEVHRLPPRLGLVTSKKTGNAVRRNRVRRVLRGDGPAPGAWRVDPDKLRRIARLARIKVTAEEAKDLLLKQIENDARHDAANLLKRLDAEARDGLEEVLLNAHAMGARIDGLLALARLTRSEVHHELVNLTSVVRAAFRRLQTRRQQAAGRAHPHRHLDAVHRHRADAELGFLVLLGQAVCQVETGRHPLGHRHLAERRQRVVVELGRRAGEFGERRHQRALRLVHLVQH